MAHRHGKNGILYMGETTAVKVANLKSWKLSIKSDKSDDTSFEDAWKAQLKGAKEWSGSVEGFYDNADDALFDAADSDTIQKFYLYPSSSDVTKYWYGTAYPDFDIEVVSDDTVKISGGFDGSGALGKN